MPILRRPGPGHPRNSFTSKICIRNLPVINRDLLLSLEVMAPLTDSVQTVSNGCDLPTPTGTRPPKRGLRFWIILFALCLTLFLSALELTAVSTALPTIVAELNGNDFVWVGAAYALASSAILPMTGGLAQLFGRKPAVLGSIAFFAVGSALCGAAHNMNMMIAGRTVQGVGGGGILSFSAIVLADLVSLEERGMYAGLFGL